MSVSSRAGRSIVFGTLCLALIGGTLAALSAVTNRNGAGGAEPRGTNLALIDLILCVFVPSGAPAGYSAEMANVHARMHQAMNDIAPTGDPDRDFARSMIPHHQGAIDMALVQLKHGRDGRLRRLAQSIIVEQGQEIAYLRSILDQLPADHRPDRVAPE
jgi:DUF305 family protein family protein